MLWLKRSVAKLRCQLGRHGGNNFCAHCRRQLISTPFLPFSTVFPMTCSTRHTAARRARLIWRQACASCGPPRSRWAGRMMTGLITYSVHDNQVCIATTAAHFWWNTDAESTAAFCPVSEAFSSWRMHWESRGIPNYLFASMRNDSKGMEARMSAEAPTCTPDGIGTRSSRSRITFSAAIFRTGFREFLEEALANAKRNKVASNKRSHTGRYTSYWAVTGRATK